MHGGSHSHGGGSSGAHSHGSGGNSSGGVVVAILLGIVVLGVIISFVVHAVSQHRALSTDSALTPGDKLIQSAGLSISCREIVMDANGKQSVGPSCSSGIKSSALAIQLVGVPGVRFTDSHARGTYSASCSVISGGDSVGFGMDMVTGKSFRDTPTVLGSANGMWLPSNTCEISIVEPVQAVAIEIDRWSVGDSNTGNFFIIRKFTAALEPGWHNDSGVIYGSQG